MQYLREAGYQFLSLDQLKEPVVSAQKAVVVTFDDGYLDNFENAIPLLEELHIPATFFIVPSLVGKYNDWMKQEGYPRRRLMNWSHIRELVSKPYFCIGSHTLTHPYLTRLDNTELKREIVDSKLLIEDRTGMKIRYFAYPYGDMDERVERMVKASQYEGACSTRSGFHRPGSENFRLKRICIYGTDLLYSFKIKLAFGTNDGRLWLPIKYYLGRIKQRLRL